ncbi:MULTISPECIES: DinB family protein [Bacillaceae]|uniref:Damage-inducible protein DinB n=1 Tax=Sutcliffiella horikoshii TaxID=79883 RepID=A0A5D4T564_9BACI|nr:MULTISPECIES: DinB family protein [Bacillaceae]TYS69336.1 damage-inducible protein DinB [Sutcliffiella horikoshii]
MELFQSQYDWIRRTRETLFQYCEGMAHADYVKEMESFGGDSIRNLHVHIATCYHFWLGTHGLGKSIEKTDSNAIKNVEDMRELFRKTDELVEEFLVSFQGNWDHTIPYTFKSGETSDFSTLWLFTHTTTHEFHHKGQIVKIGRQLGYTPPDTDLIAPEVNTCHS